MTTVKELRDYIREHRKVHCPPLSKAKKEQLVKEVLKYGVSEKSASEMRLKDLKAEVKKYRAVHCPKLSGLSKAVLHAEVKKLGFTASEKAPIVEAPKKKFVLKKKEEPKAKEAPKPTPMKETPKPTPTKEAPKPIAPVVEVVKKLMVKKPDEYIEDVLKKMKSYSDPAYWKKTSSKEKDSLYSLLFDSRIESLLHTFPDFIISGMKAYCLKKKLQCPYDKLLTKKQRESIDEAQNRLKKFNKEAGSHPSGSQYYKKFKQLSEALDKAKGAIGKV